MRHALSHLILIASLCAIAVPLRAHAAADAAAAEALFQEGRRLMRQERYQEACGKFEASHRLDGSFGALMNMGDCYLKLGRTASAWAAYREGGDLARKQSDRNRVKIAEARSAPLEPRLGRLVIVVNADQDVGSFEIRRDGQPVDLAALGTPIPVDPGEYEIEARGRDIEVWRSRVKVVVPGEQVTERITLRRSEASARPPSVVASEPSDGPEAAAGVRAQAESPWSKGFVISATSGIGYASTSSSELDTSVHGLVLQARLTGAYLVGRLFGVAALTLESATNPTLTFAGQDASGDLSMTTVSLSAGAGVRVTPALRLAAMVRLTKVSVAANGTSLDSSFGPGFEVTASHELYRRGPWGVAVAGHLGMAAVSVKGTSWTAYSAGIGVEGSYQ